MEFITEIIILSDAVLYNSAGLFLIVLGALVLVRMTGFPDLTIDGSFTIGAVVYAVTLSSGYGAAIGLTAAAVAGVFAGLNTWLINTVLGVGKVVSGVLSMIMLVLLAPYISGGSTQSLLRVDSIYTFLTPLDKQLTFSLIGEASYQLHVYVVAFWFMIIAAITLLVTLFLKSKPGIKVRYLGSAQNPTLLGVRSKAALLAIGLGIGNGLVALGGAIEAEKRGGFTVNMGTGTVLIALAALVLGESLIKSYRKREFLYMKEYMLAVAIGVLVYSLGIQILLKLNLVFIDLRLMTALFLLVLLGVAGRYHSSSAKLF